MTVRFAAILVATVVATAQAFAEPAGNAPHCGIGASIELSGDRARARDRVGVIRVRGNGLSARVAAEWRLGRFCLGGSVFARATSGLIRVGDGLESPLDDAAILQVGGAVGGSFEWSPRWWVRADIGPMWLVYVSPRVVSFATGAGISAEVSRDLAQVGRWAFGVAGRIDTAVVPDGDQTWWIGSFGIAGAVRRNW